MNWTLEYDGSEKALADWGITDSLPFEFSNQARSAVDIITVDGFDGAFQWNYGARVIIRRDRNGSGTSWSGGRRWFIGYAAEPRRLAEGPRQNHRYTLFDWWWLAERTVFRRLRKSFTGVADGHPIIATLPPSEVVLFENQLEQPIDQALQLFELISFFNECWNPTRRGATSGIDPAQDVIVDGEIECDLQCPRYPVRDVTVSEALQTVLAWTQDAVIETDYDAEVPIVSMRRKANMPAAVVHFSTERITSLNLKPRHDLVIPGVMLVWKKLHTQDGVTGLQLVKEKYPPDLSDYHPDARVHTIDLLGSMTNTLRQPLRTLAVDADHPEAGVAQHAWWAKKLPWMQSLLIPQEDFFISDVEVRDAQTGEPVSLAEFPFEVRDGQITAWMGINTKRVTISALATYTVFADAALNTVGRSYIDRSISTTITVCDYDTAGEVVTFSTIAQADEGEVVEAGLAEAIYETHHTLQHEGIVSLVGQEIPDHLHLGQLLTIITPGGVYADNLIQRISGELTRGRLDVQIGPPGHLGIADMIELMRVNRYRYTFNLPSRANTPVLDDGPGLELGRASSVQDGNTGGGSINRDAATADFEA